MEMERGLVAALGRKDDILPFRVTGAAMYITEDPAEAVRILSSLVKEGYALIFVTEDLWAGMGTAAAQYQRLYLPAISVIPGRDGTSHRARDILDNEVKKAIGIDIRKDGKR